MLGRRRWWRAGLFLLFTALLGLVVPAQSLAAVSQKSVSSVQEHEISKHRAEEASRERRCAPAVRRWVEEFTPLRDSWSFSGRERCQEPAVGWRYVAAGEVKRNRSRQASLQVFRN